jgi:hypothetical protein
MAPRTVPRLRRPFVILALIGVAGVAFALATVHTIPPRAMTLTAIGETESRIDIYVGGGNNKPPQNLDVLPKRDGYVNRTTDGWNHPLIYAVFGDDTFTLISRGRDGVPGGTGDDEDVVRRFRVARNRNGVPHVQPVP